MFKLLRFQDTHPECRETVPGLLKDNCQIYIIVVLRLFQPPQFGRM